MFRINDYPAAINVNVTLDAKIFENEKRISIMKSLQTRLLDDIILVKESIKKDKVYKKFKVIFFVRKSFMNMCVI